MKSHLSLLFAALLCAGGLMQTTAQADEIYNGPHRHFIWVPRHFALVHHHYIWVPGHPEFIR